MEIAEELFKGHLKMLCKEMLFIFKWKTGDSAIWRGKLPKQENGTDSQIPSSKQVLAITSYFQRLKWLLTETIDGSLPKKIKLILLIEAFTF